MEVNNNENRIIPDKRLVYGVAIILVVISLIILGFYGAYQSIQMENTSLIKELEAIKKSDVIAYQTAIDTYNANKYEEAKKMVEEFIVKYPQSSYIKKIKQILAKINKALEKAEIQRKIVEGFEVSSQDDAIEEWELFEEKEGKAKGLKVSWRMYVMGNLFNDPLCDIDFSEYHTRKEVLLLDYDRQVKSGQFPKLERGDVVRASGVFQFMAVGNRVAILVTRIVKENATSGQ